MPRQAIAVRPAAATRFQLITGLLLAANEQVDAGERDRAAAMLDAAGTLIESERAALMVRIATADQVEQPRRKYKRRKPKAARKPRQVRVKSTHNFQAGLTDRDRASIDAKLDAAAPRPTPPAAEKLAEPIHVVENGITVELTPNAEAFSHAGVRHLISPRGAKFILCMARGMPNPIARDFIIRKVWGASAPPSIDTALSALAGDLKPLLAQARLDLKTVRGLGYALGVAEG